MRNVILTLFSAFTLLNSVTASAQILTATNKDTVIGYYDGTGLLNVDNNLKSGSANPIYVKWNVADSYFGLGWEMIGSGFCDNQQCYSASSTANNLFVNHTNYKSLAYDNTTFEGNAHLFHMQFASTSPAIGSSAWVKISARDTVSLSSRTLVFYAYKAAVGVTTSATSSDDVVLYPNPARDAVNVIYDAKAGVQTIAVYNLIGKLMGPVYKPATNSSAKINLEDMPNGVYFLRLMNGQGHVLATRRFTRQ